jgi:hypothetical protein
LPGAERDRGGEADRLAAAEADVHVDLVGAVQGDVIDQQPRDALALARRGGGVGPELGEVGGERADARLVLVGERGVRGGAGALVVVLGALGGAQRVVVVGFESVGDEPVGGIDGEVAAAGELGVLLGAVDVAVSELVGFVGARLELGLDGERDVERERRDGVQEQLADRLVDRRSGEREADGAVALDVLADALVVGHELAAALVVADGHPPPAAATDGEALEQRGTFAGRPGGAL